jgi:hypothetical protein
MKNETAFRSITPVSLFSEYASYGTSVLLCEYMKSYIPSPFCSQLFDLSKMKTGKINTLCWFYPLSIF